MASRRTAIELSNEEHKAFLARAPFGVLGTIGPCGHPHLVTMEFSIDENESVVMTSSASGAARRGTTASSTAPTDFET